ncbi:hypothetical protein BZG36_04427 [Bifiguratus adelaidae]|uniref:Fcf2 pre-rRNA processing C-terminal domain-containing protein n=1 Tax=Bifiguratus adelaidae TaxID=1938954 RepID=A0A261XWU8_9FUNG|nr:hypothetical protein BZG36_04427 [Bifiguratus adelaidae]
MSLKTDTTPIATRLRSRSPARSVTPETMPMQSSTTQRKITRPTTKTSPAPTTRRSTRSRIAKDKETEESVSVPVAYVEIDSQASKEVTLDLAYSSDVSRDATPQPPTSAAITSKTSKPSSSDGRDSVEETTQKERNNARITSTRDSETPTLSQPTTDGEDEDEADGEALVPVEQENDVNTEDESDDSENLAEDSSSDDSEDEEEDEDLDYLLEAARQSLSMQENEVIKVPVDKTLIKIPKLNPHMDINKHLPITKDSSTGGYKFREDVLSNEKTSKGEYKSNGKAVERAVEEPRLTAKQRKEQREATTGKGWFDMPKAEMTPELERDLQILKLRNVLDPKRHYKKEGKKQSMPEYFQVGTVIEGPTEFFSSRLTNKERKKTIVDELMADHERRQYYKRKFLDIQDSRMSGGRAYYKKKKSARTKEYLK